MSELPFQVEEIKRQFDLSGDYTGYDRINNGHINNTYVLHFQENSCCKDFLLQQINTHVFAIRMNSWRILWASPPICASR